MSNFDRRQLRYFIAVAEELHFGKASQRLYISQPPLSQQIAALETDLGVQLFARTKRKVEITAAGIQFLGDARRILADMDKAAERAKAAAAGQTGLLRIGLNYSTPINPLLSTITRRFTKLYPHVRFEMHENTSGKQLEGLLHNRLDLCFIWPTRDDTSPDITIIQVSPDELHLAVAKDHPLARKSRIAPSDFHDLTIFLPPRQTRIDFFEAFMKACHKVGAEPVIRTDIVQFSFIMNIVVTGQGVAFVPEFIQRIKPKELVFRSCDFIPKSQRLYPLSLTHRTHDASPLVRNYAAVAREVITEAACARPRGAIGR